MRFWAKNISGKTFSGVLKNIYSRYGSYLKQILILKPFQETISYSFPYLNTIQCNGKGTHRTDLWKDFKHQWGSCPYHWQGENYGQNAHLKIIIRN